LSTKKSHGSNCPETSQKPNRHLFSVAGVHDGGDDDDTDGDDDDDYDDHNHDHDDDDHDDHDHDDHNMIIL